MAGWISRAVRWQTDEEEEEEEEEELGWESKGVVEEENIQMYDI